MTGSGFDYTFPHLNTLIDLQVVEAVVKEVGSGKVGLRLSPYSTEFNDCSEPDVDSTISLNVHLLEKLNSYSLAYVHIVTARADGESHTYHTQLKLSTRQVKSIT